ncbi:unnamed protein product [Paramecium sonneborni]|uniref:Uncharacterized protein n=1 Tax=Paramecium sonneborni TaxID=65129 RepID=A0A8S1KN06_9CILI|nr:unnamed protein product [Paramecium sonneborni]
MGSFVQTLEEEQLVNQNFKEINLDRDAKAMQTIYMYDEFQAQIIFRIYYGLFQEKSSTCRNKFERMPFNNLNQIEMECLMVQEIKIVLEGNENLK